MKGVTQRKKPHYSVLNPEILEYFQGDHNGQLLDLGSGRGEMADLFKEKGFQVTGIDADAERIEKSKKLYPEIEFIHFIVDAKLPFEDESFDVIFSRSFFQYVDHDAILQECNRILRKGGKLILLENLKNNPFTRMGRIVLKISGHKYHSYPWNHFTKSEILGVQKDFDNSSVHFYHLLSPLTYVSTLEKLYPILHKIDGKLLKFKPFKRFAWLVLLTGQKK